MLFVGTVHEGVQEGYVFMQVWHTPNRFREETIGSIVFMTGMQISQMRQLGINIWGEGTFHYGRSEVEI